MPTQTQPWLRAELIAAPETTPGAQLMIPADGIEFHDGDLVFHHQGDVVYVAPQGQLRSITWFARQPHPETARRKAQWPNHGTRWTDEERTNLQRHLQAGHSWKTISHAHGRSRSGCQQEAVKQGWLDPETLAPTPKLLGDEAANPAADTSASSPATNAQTATQPSATATSADSPASAGLASPANSSPTNTALAAAPTDSPPNLKSPGTLAEAPAAPANSALGPAPAGTSAGSPASAAPADSAPSPTLADTSAGPAPHTMLAASSADSPPRSLGTPDSPADTSPADSALRPVRASTAADSPPSSALGSAPNTVLAAASADSPPNPQRPGAFTSSPSAPADSPPPAFVLPRHAAAAGSEPIPTTTAYADLAQAAVTIAREARTVAETSPQIPHQRADSPAPDPDDRPEKDSPPGAGSRFLSRAQSSLARATLGAYMTPPRAT